jgi:hypothetical protein
MKARSKWIIAGCGAIVILAGASAAYYFKQNTESGPDPAKMDAEQIHTYMQSQDFNSLPRHQRRVFFEKVMNSRVQGYFNTPVENRQAYLDKVIDEMQKIRQDNPHRRDPNRIQQARQRADNRTPEQRRLRWETRDPVKDAMRREFFSALRTRAESRGIQMGRGRRVS